jgi:hypothetical protein
MLKNFFQSSIDPAKVSLTVESIAKMAIFLIGYFAVSKGFDVTQATTQVQAIRDVVLSLIPASFALYHGCTAIYGLVRKMFISK